MTRAFLLTLLLSAFCSPAFSAIDSVRFSGLTFPIHSHWSELTIIHQGFALRTGSDQTSDGTGTFSVVRLIPEEFSVQLESSEVISMIHLLRAHLYQESFSQWEDSEIAKSILTTFEEVRKVENDNLDIFLEVKTDFMNNSKAYIFTEENIVIELTSTIPRNELENYLTNL